ncbi:IS110 family transposase [Lysobacter antibioticus]|uniref:Transposase IS116/IS110/IS902 family protein n=1 Tax=Lysobacter antibioticus TaxID=84531 RepID=A0A0S2F4X6_LYSAN|nr:IS110 family transposase [Lysobacter antibioticus]ALN78575.1 transposase IS116/IS110/IS902 family protein [Lysobacter antibioticus]ALN78584.1 transposase IS116/IS110/IS902 family protein [Lysobacter antibioticus]
MSSIATIVGVDIAKNVFQLHWVEPSTGEIVNLRLKRAKFLDHFSNRRPCFVGMEACGGSQHWARRLIALGHRAVLLPAKQVKAFVHGNKNDAADARAIWTAMQQPGVKAVAIKTEGQQAILALHRMRQQLVKFRTAQINALRGLLTEYGEVMPKQRAGLNKHLPDALARLCDRLPGMLIETLRDQYARIRGLDVQVREIESRLKQWLRQDDACLRISEIPGVGMLTATAAIATMGNVQAFKSAREFSAWLGLVPRQVGTGGRVQLLGISKRGDTYVRTLLIHGARSLLFRQSETPTWAAKIAQRRPFNVAVVAIANKIARTIWALLAHARRYRSDYASQIA